MQVDGNHSSQSHETHAPIRETQAAKADGRALERLVTIKNCNQRLTSRTKTIRSEGRVEQYVSILRVEKVFDDFKTILVDTRLDEKSTQLDRKEYFECRY